MPVPTSPAMNSLSLSVSMVFWFFERTKPAIPPMSSKTIPTATIPIVMGDSLYGFNIYFHLRGIL